MNSSDNFESRTNKIDENKINDIRFALEKGEVFGQTEMDILIAADERELIGNYIEQFKELDEKTAKYLIDCGMSYIPEYEPKIFKGKVQKAVLEMVRQNYRNAA